MTATDAHALSLRGVPHRVTRRHGLVSALGVAAALHGTPRRKGVPTLLPPNHTLCLMAAGPRPAPPRSHGDMLSLEHSFLLADWLSWGRLPSQRRVPHSAPQLSWMWAGVGGRPDAPRARTNGGLGGLGCQGWPDDREGTRLAHTASLTCTAPHGTGLFCPHEHHYRTNMP